MKKFSLALVSLLLLVTTMSCEKKTLCYRIHPHDEPIVNTTFTFTIDPEFSNPIETLSLDGNLASSGDYKMRYTVEFWTVNEDGNPDTMYERQQFIGNAYSDSEMTYTIDAILLPALDMKMLVWADPINESDSEHQFDVESLQSVTLTDCGNTIDKDGFTNTIDLDFLQYTYELDGIDVTYPTITLDRAFGRYKVVANDLDRFVAAGNPIPSKMVVTYYLYIPTQYNCFLKTLQGSAMGKSYSFSPIVESSTSVVIAEDYIFSVPGASASTYWLYASAYDDQDNLLKDTKSAGVSIQANVTDVVFGSFLTDESTSRPGINDDFDGEEVIYVQSSRTNTNVDNN